MTKQLLMTALLGLVTMCGLSVPVAVAVEPEAPTNSVAKQSTKYLCQKYYHGCWETVYVCYCYEDAMDWYKKQPNNARVIAQK